MTTTTASAARHRTHVALTQTVNKLAGNWWVFLWRGIFALIFCASTLFVGAMVTPLVLTSVALASLVVIFGFFAFWSGMVELIAYAKSSEKTSALLLIDGLIGTAICLVVINFPNITASSIPLFLGGYVLLLGFLEAGISLRLHRRLLSRGLAFAVCAFMAILGIYLIQFSGEPARLITLISIAALCIGLLNIEIGREFQHWRERFEVIPVDTLHGRTS